MTEVASTKTETPAENRRMVVYDIQNTNSKNTYEWLLAHEDCAVNYDLKANQFLVAGRSVEVPRAQCQVCKTVFDPIEAGREEAALLKWRTSGDRSEYETLVRTRQGREPKAVRVPAYRPLSTDTGRVSSTRPNMSAAPSSSSKAVHDYFRKKKEVSLPDGVTSGDATIITDAEKRLHQLGQLTDEELFNEK